MTVRNAFRLTLALMGFMALAQGAIAACNSPAGTAGDMAYSSTANVMAFCDGQNWVSMAGGVSLTVNTAGGGATPAGSSADVQFNSSGALAADTGNFTYASGLLKAPNLQTGNISATTITATGAGNFGTINSTGLGTMGSLLVAGGATITGQASITTISTSLIQVGNNGAACTSSLAGGVRYNNTSNTLDYCSGSAWLSLGPSATLPNSFFVTRNGVNQSISNNSDTQVDWTTKTFDSNNNFDLSTDRFSPKVPGFYIFVLRSSFDANLGSTKSNSYIRKNSSNIAKSSVYSQYGENSLMVIAYANGSTDYFDAAVYQSSGSAADLFGQSIQTYFTGAIISTQGGGSGGSANPAGSTNDVQFNSAGLLSADTGNFTYASGVLKAPSLLTGGITGTGQASLTTISSSLVQLTSNTVTACTAALSGSQRYNSVSNTIDYCTGSAWLSLGPSGTAVPSFSVNKNGTNQTVTASTYVKLTFSNKVFDTNNNFDTGTSRFTPNVPGKYLVNLGVYCVSATSGYCIAAISKNGSNVAEGRQNSTLDSGANVTSIVDMNGTTDYLEAKVYNKGTSVDGSNGQTFFNGALLTSQGGGSGGTANTAGSTNDVQFNSGGLLAADTGLFTYASSTLTAPKISTGALTVTGQSSLTVISTTYIQVQSATAVVACGSGLAGTIRYTSGTMQLCDGSGWTNVGIGVPQGTISAFALSSCPSGWSEYTPARGRFLRGIDNGAGIDPGGTRSPGSLQGDTLQEIVGTFSALAWGTGNPTGALTSSVNTNNTFQGGTSSGANQQTYTFKASGSARTGTETRPTNVAVTFCRYDGFQSQLQTGVATLASLTDVSVAGASTGQVLTYSGGTWIASSTAVGTATPAGSTNDVQFNSGGALAADTAKFTYVAATGTLSTTTVSTTRINVASSASSVVSLIGAAGNAISSGSTVVSTSSAGNIAMFTGGAERVRVDPNGLVMINTTTPKAFLTIKNNGVNITGLDIAGYGSTTGYGIAMLPANDSYPAPIVFKNAGGSTVGIITTNATQTSYNTTSDRRVKDNIANTREGLQKLMRLPVRDFVFKADPSHTVVTGFIAQELEKIFPEAVTTNGESGETPLKSRSRPWLVDYGRVTPLIVKGLQDLKLESDARYRELKADNDNLRREVEALRREFKSMKSAGIK